VIRPVYYFVAVIFAGIGLVHCTGPQTPQWGAALPEALPVVSASQLLKEVGLSIDLIPKGRCGRLAWAMRPRYITIHSTQNFDADANAFTHARALKNGALRSRRRPGGNRTGFLTWHFTVQQNAAVQHLPTNEQGEHADYDGPGNNFSIGIEMCENRGNDRASTVERTAKLAAYLMHVHQIPLNSIVPHYHWPRVGADPLHKNCPHFLLNNGRPGPIWQWFQQRVSLHYSRIYKGYP
jgi:N-acetylmuramoyl-L-alanine amidase